MSRVADPSDLPEASVRSELEVALLTGGRDKPYAFGLISALFLMDVRIDLICGDDLNVSDFVGERRVKVFSFRQEHLPDARLLTKVLGILLYYGRLVRYAWKARPTIFHILWNNKFETIDRVFLMLYYRIIGKRIVLTAHNVNSGTRDATDSRFNRGTLRLQYRLCDHIFVHTDRMKRTLVDDYGVQDTTVTVVPFGINNAVPRTALTAADAKKRLGIDAREKTILFFGNIAPYKGLEYLITAFKQIAVTRGEYRLIVAGRPKKGSERYWNSIKETIGHHPEREGFMLKIEYIDDAETELYFKAADVLVLPYVSIFQSGVLFLGYSFGLPVLAADVGSLKEDIVDGRTGFLFGPRDPVDLIRAIETYFSSDLFRNLPERRHGIQDYAAARYSWEPVADTTRKVYADLLTGVSVRQ